jgi:hypothetical protein
MENTPSSLARQRENRAILLYPCRVCCKTVLVNAVRRRDLGDGAPRDTAAPRQERFGESDVWALECRQLD